ncbi:MAG: hypothetical protein WC878_02185 [Candidatus Paceibacterota bacterium]|jgi:hypothetical protein
MEIGKKMLLSENPADESWGADDVFWFEEEPRMDYGEGDDGILSPEAMKALALFNGICKSAKFTINAANKAFVGIKRK